MRALVQRVSAASVEVSGKVIGEIGWGLLTFLGIHQQDTESDAHYLARKVVQLRVFDDESGRMNRSVKDNSGELLVVSQFTLYGDTRKGNRPSYSEAASGERAKHLYELFIENCKSYGLRVATGRFQAEMKVRLINEGPVTLLCYSDGRETQSSQSSSTLCY
jgi:D-aminoacyl-tRNA deacylase